MAGVKCQSYYIICRFTVLTPFVISPSPVEASLSILAIVLGPRVLNWLGRLSVSSLSNWTSQYLSERELEPSTNHSPLIAKARDTYHLSYQGSSTAWVYGRNLIFVFLGFLGLV